MLWSDLKSALSRVPPCLSSTFGSPAPFYDPHATAELFFNGAKPTISSTRAAVIVCFEYPDPFYTMTAPLFAKLFQHFNGTVHVTNIILYNYSSCALFLPMPEHVNILNVNISSFKHPLSGHLSHLRNYQGQCSFGTIWRLPCWIAGCETRQSSADSVFFEPPYVV